jgi:hypothetical protein
VETKIDKNVPIPLRSGVNKSNSKYHRLNKIVESWEVGDSVAFKFVRKTSGKEKRASYSIEAIALVGRAKKAGQKTSQRVMADEGVIRVWRVG